MREQHVRMITIITSLMATFVIYLCVSILKMLPLFFIVSVTVLMASLLVVSSRTGYAVIKKYTQKTE